MMNAIIMSNSIRCSLIRYAVQRRPRALAERVSLLGIFNTKAVVLAMTICGQNTLSDVGYDSFLGLSHASH